MDERWHGSLFQIYEVRDENDLDFAIAVFRVGKHIGVGKHIDEDPSDSR